MNLEDKVDKLKMEAMALRKEMIIMKTLVKQQTKVIKVLLERAQQDEVSGKTIMKTRNWFPIRTQDELDNFEKSVDPSNRDEVIREAQLCIRREGIGNAIRRIIDERLILNYNLEGTYNKRRFLDYHNLLDVLFKATQPDGPDHTNFIAQLRQGIKRIKKKHLKRQNYGVDKKIIKEIAKKEETEDDDEDDDDDEGEGEGEEEGVEEDCKSLPMK